MTTEEKLRGQLLEAALQFENLASLLPTMKSWSARTLAARKLNDRAKLIRLTLSERDRSHFAPQFGEGGGS